MYFAILVNLSTSFLLSPFFTGKIIISSFYFPHGGRTSSDPNWPLRTLFFTLLSLLFFFFFLLFFFFYFSSFLLFYLSSGGRTSSDPNWPLRTLLPQRIVTNIGVWEDSDKHSLFIGKKTSFNERRLESWKCRSGIQPLDAALVLFLFSAAFLLNLTQLPLNFEFLFLVCLQSDMFAVGGHESTLLCCIGVSDRRSVIVTSFFFSFFCFYIDLRLLYFCYCCHFQGKLIQHCIG